MMRANRTLRPQCRQTVHGRAARLKRGFTIVELLVAMVMLSVGILALAGTAAVTVRQLGGARQQILAANVAQVRLEQLMSANCTTLSSGSAAARGVSESWTVTDSARAKFVVETVRFQTRGVTRTQSYKAMITC